MTADFTGLSGRRSSYERRKLGKSPPRRPSEFPGGHRWSFGGATRLPREEDQERIKAYCTELCKEWSSLRLEVTEANAPRDPACRLTRWALRSPDGWYRTKCACDRDPRFALRWQTKEAAQNAAAEYGSISAPVEV